MLFCIHIHTVLLSSGLNLRCPGPRMTDHANAGRRVHGAGSAKGKATLPASADGGDCAAVALVVLRGMRVSMHEVLLSTIT